MDERVGDFKEEIVTGIGNLRFGWHDYLWCNKLMSILKIMLLDVLY